MEHKWLTNEQLTFISLVIYNYITRATKVLQTHIKYSSFQVSFGGFFHGKIKFKSIIFQIKN